MGNGGRHETHVILTCLSTTNISETRIHFIDSILTFVRSQKSSHPYLKDYIVFGYERWKKTWLWPTVLPSIFTLHQHSSCISYLLHGEVKWKQACWRGKMTTPACWWGSLTLTHTPLTWISKCFPSLKSARPRSDKCSHTAVLCGKYPGHLRQRFVLLAYLRQLCEAGLLQLCSSLKDVLTTGHTKWLVW